MMKEKSVGKGYGRDRHKFKDRITVRLSSEKKELFKQACEIKGVSQSEMILYWIDEFIEGTV